MKKSKLKVGFLKTAKDKEIKPKAAETPSTCPKNTLLHQKAMLKRMTKCKI
jgi:hypothetical protein